MNRIIIIGNGFDKAHDLPTGYTDFINHYWSEFASKVFGGEYLVLYKDERDIIFKDGKDKHTYAYFKGSPQDRVSQIHVSQFHGIDLNCSTYADFKETINKCNIDLNERRNTWNRQWRDNIKSMSLKLVIDNAFLNRISEQCLENWVDVESEYYESLKELLEEEGPKKRNEKIKKLNRDFYAVKELLEKYLVDVTENAKIKQHESIKDAFSSLIEVSDIVHSKQNAFLDSIISEMGRLDDTMELEHGLLADPSYQIFTETEAHRHWVLNKLKNERFQKSYCTPNQALILNFNYTNTAAMFYSESMYKAINIHGELNSKKNPIIFGYGDELDDKYKEIEKLQDNDFLENIKSINYHKTRNYRKLLSYIESGLYQVFVMGHSCGNSDRTLLNTLFEHENCVSVKVFYQQFEDGSDDHSNLIRNISRNFNDKPKMRDVVVNWEDCTPLVPIRII